MIPLAAISQKRYIISNDTIIGYTLKENRSIALIFLKGEEAEKLNFKYKEIIKYKDSLIYHNNNVIKFQDSTIVVQQRHLKELTEEVVYYEEQVIKERQAKRRAIWIAVGSGILNVVLLSIAI